MKAQTPAGVKAVDQSQPVETVKESLLRRWVYIQVRWAYLEDGPVPEGLVLSAVNSVITFDYRFVVAVDEETAYAVGFEHMQGDGLLNDYVIDVENK